MTIMPVSHAAQSCWDLPGQMGIASVCLAPDVTLHAADTLYSRQHSIFLLHMRRTCSCRATGSAPRRRRRRSCWCRARCSTRAARRCSGRSRRCRTWDRRRPTPSSAPSRRWVRSWPRTQIRAGMGHIHACHCILTLARTLRLECSSRPAMCMSAVTITRPTKDRVLPSLTGRLQNLRIIMLLNKAMLRSGRRSRSWT